MHGICTVGCYSHQNMKSPGAHLSEVSVEAVSVVNNKIKNGFFSLLKSISNSFKCFVKLFSFSNGSQHINADKKSTIYFESVPSVAIDEREATILRDNWLRSSHQEKFHKLNMELHARLGVGFKCHINKNK